MSAKCKGQSAKFRVASLRLYPSKALLMIFLCTSRLKILKLLFIFYITYAFCGYKLKEFSICLFATIVLRYNCTVRCHIAEPPLKEGGGSR